MKLITLNIWGGYVKDPLLEFIKTHQDIDIFCLQEVYHNADDKISDEDRKVCLNILSEIQTLLPLHTTFFRPAVNEIYGICMLVKKNVDVVSEGVTSIHDAPNYPGRGPSHARHLQWLKYRNNNQTVSVVNVHGLWNGMGKTDTPERIAQSERIKNFMDSIDSHKILCGDFNLRPDTESLKMLEKGMNNLIHIHNINSTRTSLYPKPEKFADYIFTSPEITVNKFAVLPDEVSDHSPLLLDFS